MDVVWKGLYFCGKCESLAFESGGIAAVRYSGLGSC